MSAIIIATITPEDRVVARRNGVTYDGIATRTYVGHWTRYPKVEIRIDATTSTDFTRGFFASELIHHEARVT